MSNELTPTDTSDREEDDLFAARARSRTRRTTRPTSSPTRSWPRRAEARTTAKRPPTRRRAPTTEADDEDEEEDEAEEADDEEVPVFLTHRGKLLLFHSAEGLVSFIRSGAPNDSPRWTPGPSWSTGSEPVNVAPLDEDTYELDLVVENLRGGHDSWDPPLLIEAGEVARDLSYALRLPACLTCSPPATASMTSTKPCVARSTAGSAGSWHGAGSGKSGHKPQVWAGARLSARSLPLWTGATDP